MIFRSFLSKSWIHVKMFGNFLCCYRAATKWNWPAAVTLFFATVPMLRICSLLSCRQGQGQKHRCPTPFADCRLPSLPGISLGSSGGHKDKRASTAHRRGAHLKLQSATSALVISWPFSLENLGSPPVTTLAWAQIHLLGSFEAQPVFEPRVREMASGGGTHHPEPGRGGAPLPEPGLPVQPFPVRCFKQCHVPRLIRRQSIKYCP